MSAGCDGEPARPGVLDGSSVSLGQGPHPKGGRGGGLGIGNFGEVLPPAKLVPGQLRGCRANGCYGFRVPGSVLSKSKVQGQ